MKTKILLASGGLNVGGAEKWLIDFISNIDHDKFEVGFILHGNDEHFFESQAIIKGAKIHRLGNQKNIFSYLWKINRIIKKYGYDIIHGHVNHFSSVYLVLKVFSNVKVIVHSHNDLSLKVKNSKIHKKIYFKLASLLISKYADSLIGVSDKAANSIFILDGPNISKYKKIYCGLDILSLENRLKDSVGNESLDLLRDRSRKIVFHVGRFVEQKNHNYILNIAEKCGQDVQFCLFGDGPLRENIEQQCNYRNIQNVFFFGNVKDVDILMYRYADCMILPSLHEGLPVVLMEAQACSLKSFVSTNVSKECNVTVDLIDYISLADVSAWVDRINAPDKRTYAINSDFKGSQFDIRRSAEEICNVYLKVK